MDAELWEDTLLRRATENIQTGLFLFYTHTHTQTCVRMNVADAAVRRTCGSICPGQWGSGGPSRAANQSPSPPRCCRGHPGSTGQTAEPRPRCQELPFQLSLGKFQLTSSTCARSQVFQTNNGTSKPKDGFLFSIIKRLLKDRAFDLNKKSGYYFSTSG